MSSDEGQHTYSTTGLFAPKNLAFHEKVDIRRERKTLNLSIGYYRGTL